MLKSLTAENFTPFVRARLDFGTRLNVIVGENGLGKTHLLKLPYAVLAAREALCRGNGETWTKGALQRELADKLVGVFRPDSLGRLVRRRQGRDRAHIEVALRNGESEAAPDSRLAFRFSTNSQKVVVEAMPKPQAASRPVFLPTRELLTLHPGLVAHYETHHLDVEETWVDTCRLLQLPALRGPRLADIAALLEPVERAMGGKVVLDHTGRFYLRSSHGATLEMPLVAEGHRKFATLAQLLVNGSLLKQGFLFWDEPDANLNPILIRQVAEAILNICRGGVQTFIATHSLFLLREIEILLGSEGAEDDWYRWFALRSEEGGVLVEQGDSPEALQTIACLDASLDQSDRFLAGT